jgi:hypothetical protein
LTGILLSLLLAAGNSMTAYRLPPVDQCAADASFAAFRRDLTAAIERRDSSHLLSIVSPEIEFSFGGDSGRAQFARAWELESPRISALWGELSAALRLGCARGGDGAYWAPSLFILENSGGDPFETYVAAPDAVLRAAAGDSAAEVARLEWDVLRGEQVDGAPGWLAVRLADGRRGFVRGDQVRSVIDYRAGFERTGGRWMMTVFIAGD